MEDITKRLLEEVDIVEVISERLDVTKKGNNYVALCPFHQDHNPSMSISPTKKIFRCFSCGAGGNVIKFVMDFDHISYREALALLAKRIGVVIESTYQNNKDKLYYQAMESASQFYQFFLKNTEEGEKALAYLTKRGIDDNLIEQYKIGLAPLAKQYLHLSLNESGCDLLIQKELGLVKEDERGITDMFHGRIMFPITDKYGRVVAFSGRTYLKDDKTSKYVNSIENLIFKKSKTLYNLANASNSIRQKNGVYVLEGFMDVIALGKAGINNCVATMGTALTNDHINLLKALTKNITLCFDGDNAGIEATKKAFQLLHKSEIMPYAISLPEGLDPDEYQQKYGSDALRRILEDDKKVIYEYLFDYYKQITDFSNPVSIEYFKNEVIKMLKITNNQTFTNFYLDELAKLIKQTPEQLQLAYNRFSGHQTLPSYQVVPKSNDNVTQEPPKRTISKAVLLALDNIIYHCIKNQASFTKYYQLFKDEYYDDQLNAYSCIIFQVKELYEKNPTSSRLSFEELLDYFKENNEAFQIIKRLTETTLFEDLNYQEFEDCLTTLRFYIEKEKNRIKYLSAQENDEKIEDFLEHRRKHTKLK